MCSSGRPRTRGPSWKRESITSCGIRKHTGPVLEDLLQAYETSVGASGVGTPKELIDREVRVAPERATVHRAGPVDCTAREDGTDPDETAAGAGDNEEAGNCAAAIHGGTDDISPLQLWHTVMQNTK